MSAVPAIATISDLPENVILEGDALAVLRTLPDNSVDALVTDPPAGIAFMGKHWDSDKGGRDAWIAWLAEILCEAWRVTKPGGHALVWALPRTSHWTAMALEDAGWEIRERIAHINGQGFPKSLDVSKQLDKMAGAQREVVGKSRTLLQQRKTSGAAWQWDDKSDIGTHIPITAPATDAARQWDGYGTALKPAVEDWWLCRKPLSEKNVAANVLRWGTGALNIGASRVGSESVESGRFGRAECDSTSFGRSLYPTMQRATTAGRFPANLLLSHSIWCTDAACADGCPVRALDAQSGVTKSSDRVRHNSAGKMGYHGAVRDFEGYGFNDTGGASRYFQTFRYQAKASRAERNRGCEGLEAKAAGVKNTSGRGFSERDPYAPVTMTNHHPTVKPLTLMSWLIGLITPPGGIVLDCFAGSGSTLVAAKAGGWRYIGIEKEAEYVAIAEARIQAS